MLTLQSREERPDRLVAHDPIISNRQMDWILHTNNREVLMRALMATDEIRRAAAALMARRPQCLHLVLGRWTSAAWSLESETMRITATRSGGWMERAAFYTSIDRSVLVTNLRRLRQIGVSHVI